MPKLITPHLQHDQPLDPQRADDHAEFHFDNYANTFTRLVADFWSFEHALKFVRKKAGCVTWFSLSPNVLKG